MRNVDERTFVAGSNRSSEASAFVSLASTGSSPSSRRPVSGQASRRRRDVNAESSDLTAFKGLLPEISGM